MSSSEDKYKSELYSSWSYSQVEFDKSLTFISAGLLAGTFAFIDKIVHIDHAINKGLLLTGWTILGLAIGLSSIGHLRSIYHISNSIKIYKEVDDEPQRRARLNSEFEIACINYCTIALIVIGALCVFGFIYKNFNL